MGYMLIKIYGDTILCTLTHCRGSECCDTFISRGSNGDKSQHIWRKAVNAPTEMIYNRARSGERYFKIYGCNFHFRLERNHESWKIMFEIVYLILNLFQMSYFQKCKLGGYIQITPFNLVIICLLLFQYFRRSFLRQIVLKKLPVAGYCTGNIMRR